MSVTAHSPFVGHKRLHRDTDASESQESLSPKRLRTFSGSPPPACARRERRVVKLGRSQATALRGLFPGMDEKVVVEVLDSCNGNIDEAIKRLGNLQLVADSNGEHVAGHSRPASGYPSPAPSPPPEGLGRHSGSSGGAASSAKAVEDQVEKSPAEWVEGLVQQMAAATDMTDARVRATHELRAFEQTVMQSSSKAKQAEIAVLQSKLMELAKENSVLKRAVAIQQGRLVEALDVNKAQASEAKDIVAQLQSKVHILEMTNYSLSMHLRQATGNAQPDSSHPDVF